MNVVVTNVLKPFLTPAPSAPEPFSPVIWAVLGWVRRNLFNQAPTINPTTTVQTGQTVTGNLGATDAEGDTLTYKVTQQPQHGTLTIDQATGTYTYTPDDINYTAAQTDSFTVSVADGKVNLLSLFSPHSAKASVDVTVLNPTVERVILDLPGGITLPDTPRFAEDGRSIYFAAKPPAGGRKEIYQINVDGTNLECMTCGLSPSITADLGRVAPSQDGSGRLMIQVRTSPNSYVVFEDDANGRRLVPVINPVIAPGVIGIDPQREMRISPDGTHVAFTQIQLVPKPSDPPGIIAATPVVGKLTRTTNATTGAPEYHIDDARVVFPTGEIKQWTPDGKGVIIIAGLYEAGNVDDVVVDLATGAVTRLTANLDYEEDIDMSPNEKWIAVGSTRNYDALTPMSRIVRPGFLPAFIQGSVYEAYAGGSDVRNISNQEWAVAIEDELKGENGIPLFVDGDGFTARSMASWNATGDAVAIWEASPTDGYRLVIAKLKYTTSVGPGDADRSTPDAAGYTWAPVLSSYVPATPPLPAVGTYAGPGGGTAVVSEAPDPDNPAKTKRIVTYTNYVNDEGMILNGTEWTSAGVSQNNIRYVANITVTGEHTGYLTGDVVIDKLTRSISATSPGSMITSEVDGDVLVLLDQNRIDADRANI